MSLRETLNAGTVALPPHLAEVAAALPPHLRALVDALPERLRDVLATAPVYRNVVPGPTWLGNMSSQ